MCGNNVTAMYRTYHNCYNLTGSPVCGNSVTNMGLAYANCYNLTGVAIVGSNVTNATGAYANCENISRNAYIYSNNITDMLRIFDRTRYYSAFNIYVHEGSATHALISSGNSNGSMFGVSLTWTNAGTYLYNASYRTYVYLVANVAAARAANGD